MICIRRLWNLQIWKERSAGHWSATKETKIWEKKQIGYLPNYGISRLPTQWELSYSSLDAEIQKHEKYFWIDMSTSKKGWGHTSYLSQTPQTELSYSSLDAERQKHQKHFWMDWSISKRGVGIYWISLDLLVPRLFVCKNGDDVRIVSYHGSWSSGLIDLWERRRVNPATLIWSLCSIDDKTVKQKYLFSTVLNYHVAQIWEEGQSSFACCVQ